MSAGDVDFHGTERFEIRRSLGTGAFGAVYEALDRERNTVVALKRLHQATAEGLYRFKREFRSLADLHHHNLVCLYELLADGENWFFTMELVRGMSFLDFVREPAAPERVAPEREAQADDLLETVARGGPPRAQLACDLHRLRTTSSQLAEGLRFLHRNRKLHRDLKSSNALVTREGRVVILDFGLVFDQDASGLLRTMDAQIIGTPAYMAPEQAAEIFRNQCTGAVWELFNSQLYSLATLFFLGELKKVSRRQPELMRDARARSDLRAETMLRLGNGMFSHGIRLAADDPEGARQEIRTAIASWSHRGFLLQHFFELLALAEIDLYCGEGMAAWTRVRERWPALKRSLLLGIQELLIHALALRARSGVAAAALHSGERRLLLSSAERDARRIEREGAVWGNGLSFAVRAGVAWKREKREEAHSFLIAAENAFETAEMGLHAAVARRCRGELLGGEPGELLLRAADRWLADQGVRNPERYAAMILPGNWRRLNS